MSKTIGVIGLGSIGLRHAKNLLAMGHKVYGCDPDGARIAELEKLGGQGMHDPVSDGGSGFNTIRLTDGVVVASPTPLHLDHLSTAILRRRPCFVEKPISDKWVTAVDEILVDAKSPVMMGNNLRFHSCVKAAKEEIKTIGKPIWASFTVSQKNTKYTDPCILNWGAHEVDLALYLLGPATVTAAVGNDQWMDVCLLHEYGVPSTIHVDYLAPIERRGFCILGEQANMSANLVQRKFILTGTNVDLVQPLGGSFDQDYKDEMQAFIDLIDGKQVPHAATGQDGLHALELILEAKRMAS